MNEQTRWVNADQAARFIISAAGRMLIAAARTPDEFDTAEAEFVSAASALEQVPNEAAQTVGILAHRIVMAAVDDGVAGRSSLMDAISGGSITGDPNANHFVALHLRAAFAVAVGDAAAKEVCWNTLTASLDNLATQPAVAARAARALATRCAMIETSSRLETLPEKD